LTPNYRELFSKRKPPIIVPIIPYTVDEFTAFASNAQPPIFYFPIGRKPLVSYVTCYTARHKPTGGIH